MMLNPASGQKFNKYQVDRKNNGSGMTFAHMTAERQ
jgi:hypothetical protein